MSCTCDSCTSYLLQRMQRSRDSLPMLTMSSTECIRRRFSTIKSPVIFIFSELQLFFWRSSPLSLFLQLMRVAHSSDFVFKIKLNVFGTLLPQNCIYIVLKISNFRSDFGSIYRRKWQRSRTPCTLSTFVHKLEYVLLYLWAPDMCCWCLFQFPLVCSFAVLLESGHFQQRFGRQ